MTPLSYLEPTIKTDMLIIGSGIAGLSLALKAAKLGKVAIITKKERSTSNTNWAQGGIAAVTSADDSFESHIQDTLNAGVGLCNKEAVNILVAEGPMRIKELLDIGVSFTMQNGKLDLAREGGHSKSRVIHASDVTGRAIETALIEAVKREPNIEVLEHHAAVELITEHHLQKKTNNIHCYGAYALDEKNKVFKKIIARFTVLASGGAGHVYLHTTNPSIATGDGVAMAYRAGAEIRNMEFIQFHPTTLYHPEAPGFLITEAMRGFGAVLRLKNGETFMQNYDPRESLAPRDIVARAIDTELKKHGEQFVYLDATHLDKQKLIEHFPNIYEKCMSLGIDITQDLIPVVPAVHYFCGGVATNMDADTSIRNLYACGEVACTGVHGANRLASNSLLEAVVFAHRAFLNVSSVWNDTQFIAPSLIPDWDDSGAENIEEWILVSHNRLELQHIMNNYVGIVRSDLRLKRAQRRIDFLKEETERYYKKTKISTPLIELRNLIKVASLVVESSIKRRESRGLHYTTDYPERDDVYFLQDTVLRSF